ncbi:MAG TPA: VOC family protein, partial [Burkholderiaceae bacterium]|nr:VOC family protein [Burkholderiaceae bacterium]
MNRSEFDHLVIACAKLDDGIDWVERQLGVRPTAGGQHVAMGTHNALLNLGPRAFLEVIAIDPEGAPPKRPRWFALDEPEMRAQLATGPRLITWVVRCQSLATACGRVPDLGEILPMSRGEFRWKIAVPETGSLAWGGVLPTAIQWMAADDGAVHHPCDVLEDSGCELVRLQLSHPAAVLGTSGIVGMFRELKIIGPVDLAPGPKML